MTNTGGDQRDQWLSRFHCGPRSRGSLLCWADGEQDTESLLGSSRSEPREQSLYWWRSKTCFCDGCVIFGDLCPWLSSSRYS